MARHDWVIRRPVLVGVGASLVVYAIVAEAVHSHPITLSLMPSESALNHRLQEYALFWTLLCSVAGWISVLRKRPPPRDAQSWPIIVVPALLGVWVSATETWWAYQNDLLPDPFLGWLYIVAVVLHLVAAGILCGALWAQAYVWRRYARAGLCYVCGYDLRGSASNRCSECGTQIDEDGSSRPPASPRLYPELVLFETAAQRDAAWQYVADRLRRNPRFWCLWVLAALALICSGVVEWHTEALSWLMLGLAVVLSAMGVLIVHRAQRRMLRQRLVELGIRVCLNCGCDLRDGGGPRCRDCGDGLAG